MKSIHGFLVALSQACKIVGSCVDRPIKLFSGLYQEILCVSLWVFYFLIITSGRFIRNP